SVAVSTATIYANPTVRRLVEHVLGQKQEQGTSTRGHETAVSKSLPVADPEAALRAKLRQLSHAGKLP
ncbi:hypothetical protein, partial [Ciceribacter ferrooxidans]|uniref:hypothetical protein n=1 Tax=Ciceribacter ferrooxidans TaxID=2509717 RepID=UPI0013EE10EE